MRFQGEVTQIKRDEDENLVAVVRSPNGANYVIPGQEHWFPTLSVDFGGYIDGVNDDGLTVHINWIVVGETNV